MNIPRGKAICKLYRDGFTVTEIAKAIGIDHSQVDSYLRTYYEKIYDEKYVPFAQRRAEFLKDLYDKYMQVYVKGVYSQKELCKLLGCKASELQALIQKYHLNNQWLKTYNNQVTMFNASKEFRAETKRNAERAKDLNLIDKASVRAWGVYCIAMGNMFLNYLEDK